MNKMYVLSWQTDFNLKFRSCSPSSVSSEEGTTSGTCWNQNNNNDEKGNADSADNQPENRGENPEIPPLPIPERESDRTASSSEHESPKRESADEPLESPETANRKRLASVTTMSLDRIRDLIEQEKQTDTETETESEEEEDGNRLSINHRPRSASVGHLATRLDPEQLVDLPRAQPLTDRSKRDTLGENSDRELISLLGPSRNLNIWIGTWNLNLSTNVNLAHLKNFLNVQSATRKDLYIFGCQEILVEGIFEWEVALQKCLGRKYILLHAVRYGTIHLAIFIRHELQSKVIRVG